MGNDIVNLVFFECDPDKTPSFKPSMMKTRFTRILYSAYWPLTTRSHTVPVPHCAGPTLCRCGRGSSLVVRRKVSFMRKMIRARSSMMVGRRGDRPS